METKQRPVIAPDITLHAIVGPMFSGKTETLITELKNYTQAGLKAIVIRPSIDIRSRDALKSHGDLIWLGPQEYIDKDNPEKALDIVLNGRYDAVGFDECQFYSSPKIVSTLLKLAYVSIEVHATMLDLDFRGLPYGFSPQIISYATSVSKLSAICSVCKNKATRTQRLDDVGNPVVWNDRLNVIGDENVRGCRYYQARCTNDHTVLDENGNRVIVLDAKGTLLPWEQFVNIE